MMKERGPGGNPNQEFTDPEREQRRQQELLDGTNLLPEILKERMPAPGEGHHQNQQAEILEMVPMKVVV